jgi:hypothetical protein
MSILQKIEETKKLQEHKETDKVYVIPDTKFVVVPNTIVVKEERKQAMKLVVVYNKIDDEDLSVFHSNLFCVTINKNSSGKSLAELLERFDCVLINMQDNRNYYATEINTINREYVKVVYLQQKKTSLDTDKIKQLKEQYHVDFVLKHLPENIKDGVDFVSKLLHDHMPSIKRVEKAINWVRSVCSG